MPESNIYAYLTPVALFFVLLEIALCLIYRRDYISFPEAIANFGTALGNQTVNVLIGAGVYVVYGFLWENYRLFTIELNWWSFILLLLGVDFIFYWVHRWGHAINIMWAAHSPHHSAEEMNFFVALRASVTQCFCSFLFFWPLALIGDYVQRTLPVICIFDGPRRRFVFFVRLDQLVLPSGQPEVGNSLRVTS